MAKNRRIYKTEEERLHLIHLKESLLQPPITGALLLGSLVNIGLHWQG